jgi:hypothetical protein
MKWLIPFIAMVGCAHPVNTKFTDENGEECYFIVCPNRECYLKTMGEDCPNGYVKKDTEDGVVVKCNKYPPPPEQGAKR